MEQEERGEPPRGRGGGSGRRRAHVQRRGTHGGSGEEQGEEAAPLAAWVAGAPHLRPGWHPARWRREARGGEGGRGKGYGSGEESRPSAPAPRPRVPRR